MNKLRWLEWFAELGVFFSFGWGLQALDNNQYIYGFIYLTMGWLFLEVCKDIAIKRKEGKYV